MDAETYDETDTGREPASAPEACQVTDDLMRTETGIPGLDEMIEGGVPFPSTILLAGGTGCGKTTFALQFLFAGAQRGETGIYFTTFSEPPQWMLRFASRFSFVDREMLGREVRRVELGKILAGEESSRHQAQGLIDALEEEISDCMPQRIVIDPITVLENRLGEYYREFLYNLSAVMKNWQTITLLTGEIHGDRYPLEVAYSADGVFLLDNVEQEEGRRRYFEVLKLRGTDHMSGKHSFDISRDGVRVQPGLK